MALAEVCVLMSTYNGERYIQEQIESILHQENVTVHILVRDDGSNDGTLDILKKYEELDKLELVKGQNIGWRLSFMELLYDSSEYNYYAFCDQDDIWLPNKLNVAIQYLSSMPANDPNLYCSNLNYYKDGEQFGLVVKSAPQLSLEFALMRSLAAGCTMVFNSVLRDSIKCNKPRLVIAHDYWVYQVATLLGNVYYDMNSYILYRQHSNNQIGVRIKKKEIWKKRLMNAKNNFFCADRKNAARELLRLYSDALDDEKIKALLRVAYFDNNIKNRLCLFFDRTYTMESFVSDFWLRLRILFGEI